MGDLIIPPKRCDGKVVVVCLASRQMPSESLDECLGDICVRPTCSSTGIFGDGVDGGLVFARGTVSTLSSLVASCIGFVNSNVIAAM